MVDNDYKRIEEIKLGIDNNTILPDDISDEDLPLVNAIFKYEVFLARDEFKKKDEILNDYKQRMLNAIEYLRNKNANSSPKTT